MDGEAEGRAAAAVDPGETKLVDACREHDLKQSEVESVDGHVREGAASGA